jgi:hypothetical protein
MIKNAEDLIKLYYNEPISSNPFINNIRREIAILNSITACDVVLMEQDVVSDEYLGGFVRHWTVIRRELIEELSKCRES